MSKVSVVMAIYNPNIDYLKKQLESIEGQTYRDLELIVYDDCPEHRTDIKIFDGILKNTKYKFLNYEDKNLGYIKVFEKLVSNVKDSKYIAFCDQDDIWESNKIEKMVEALECSKSNLAICDRMIIDENDNIVKHYDDGNRTDIIGKWREAKDIYMLAPFQTIGPGMSIVCNAEFAKKVLPYDPVAFDKWLICCAALENKIIKVTDELVRYRRHSNNVSGVLNGINSKDDYYKYRIEPHDYVVNKLNNLYKDSSSFDLTPLIEFSHARTDKNIFKLYKYRYVCKVQAKFEIALALTPNFVFKLLLKLLRKD